MAKKRANGEGNIYKRDNGSWEARYTVNGKRHSIYGKTQTEVRKKLTEALSQIDREEYIEDSGMTVSQWLTIWQRDYLGNVKQGVTVQSWLNGRFKSLTTPKAFPLRGRWREAPDEVLSKERFPPDPLPRKL